MSASPTTDERTARPVDYANAAGKKHELEPVPGGDIANLPPAASGSGPAEDVEMADTPAVDDAEDGADSADDVEVSLVSEKVG